MSLEKEIKIDRIEVVENGTVQVRQATIITEDGNQISRTFHRWVITPSQDYSDQEDKVKDTLGADDVSKAEEVITEGLKWLDDHTESEPSEYEDKRKSVETVVQPIMMKLYASQMPADAPTEASSTSAGPKSEEVD